MLSGKSNEIFSDRGQHTKCGQASIDEDFISAGMGYCPFDKEVLFLFKSQLIYPVKDGIIVRYIEKSIH